MEPRYGKQVRGAARSKTPDQVYRKVISQPQKEGLSHGRLRLWDGTGQRIRNLPPSVIEPPMECDALTLANKGCLGEGHYRPDALAGQIGGGVEVVEDGW